MTADAPISMQGAACPLPIERYPHVLLAHGGGGRMSQMLVEELFAAAFGDGALGEGHDGAVFEVAPGRLAMSTDSFVISPLFFPGGDIGSLAVHGTVNDLAMCGARPTKLSCGFILEEGLAMETLWRVARSMAQAAQAAAVRIVTGDTKVVERGKADGLYINTTGIGVVPDGTDIAPRRAQPGDVVLLSGPIAAHGMAIMSARQGLELSAPIVSDSAALAGLVDAILQAGGNDVHVLRDPTRGGVASGLIEIAERAGSGIELDEATIEVEEPVRGACELLGLDPLYVANEGKCLAIVASERAEAVLAAMRHHPLAARAARVGQVVDAHPGKLVLRTAIGGRRVVTMMSGEQLPRIC